MVYYRMFGYLALWLLCSMPGGHTQVGEIQEVCNMDTFTADCGKEEVILMQTAHYGRMRLGKCVSVNYGNLGCMYDVLNIADDRCSGQRRCNIKLPDDSLMDRTTCPKDVTPYLEASYICLPVTPLKQSECRDSEVLLTTQYGFLSPQHLPSSPSSSTSTTSFACNVVVRVSPGQRINVTLFDFGTSSHASSERSSGNILCQKYATIREEAVPKDDVVCSGRHRVRNVFVSDGHQIHVSLVPFASSRYVLQYEALGCPVPELSAHAHVTVSGDNAVVTCNSTGEKWYIVCRDAKWIGEIGRCAQMQVQDDSTDIWSVLTNDWTTPYGILIVIGLGIGLGVVIGVVLLVGVLFCMKRHDRNRPPAQGGPMMHDLETDTCALTATLRKTYCPLPVTHHQTYHDDSPDLYSWRGGRQHPDDICGSNNNTTTTTTATPAGGTRILATRVAVRQPMGPNGGGGGFCGQGGNCGDMELVTGTCLNSNVNNSENTTKTAGKGGLHLYEMPK